MQTIELNIIPMPKPRLTKQGRFSMQAKKYYAWCTKLQWCAKIANYVPGDVLNLTFVLPMPKNWNKHTRQEMEGYPHQKRPDLDNLLKAFKDGLLKEDAHIHTYQNVKKIWGTQGKILIHM